MPIWLSNLSISALALPTYRSLRHILAWLSSHGFFLMDLVKQCLDVVILPMAAVANYYECSGFTEGKCIMRSVAQKLYMSLKWLSWQRSILWGPMGGISFLPFCSWSASVSLLCGPLAPSSKWIIGLNTSHSLTLLPRLPVIRFDLLGECRTIAPWKRLH